MRHRTRALGPLALVHVLLLGVLAGCPGKTPDNAPPPVERPLDYVDPLIATAGFGFRIASGYPGAGLPNGMVKVSPDTNGPMGLAPFMHYSGYNYEDDKIQGFSHLHLQGTGAWDMGIIAFMPTDAFDATRTHPGGGSPTGGYQSPFRKETERASAGYYAVTLDRGSIDVELTVTTRTAHHRYAFPAGAAEGYVILDLAKTLFGGTVKAAALELDRDNQRIRGTLHSIGNMSRGFGGTRFYFEARSRQPWADAQVWADGGAPAPGTSVTGDNIGAALRFVLSGEPVELQVGVSIVSPEGAAANLAAEQPAWDFAGTRAAAERTWNDVVSAVKVYGGTEKQRRIFYSGLYRAFLMPTTYTDVDGRYHGHDGQVRTAEGYTYVSDLSLWDTYRTVQPLYALIAPERARDTVMSLHAMARDGNDGYPRWPLATGGPGIMVGAPADIAIADAYVKGITDFDVEDAYARLRAAALDRETPPTGRGARGAPEAYFDLHYVPLPAGRPASVTIELNHADFALAQLARALGRHEDADHLMERRLGYRKLFDPASGFLRAKDAAGNVRAGAWDPALWDEKEYAEASGWQTLFGPQHDVEGLIELVGGQSKLLEMLGTMFAEAKAKRELADSGDLLAQMSPSAYYEHGNEPSLHIGYTWAQAGRPAMTQHWVHWVREVEYDDKPAGLAGNDDGGTLSSWYVFSALGLYPIAGSDRYVVGTPLFPKAEVRVPGGIFTVEGKGAAEGHYYVQSVTLNGVPLEVPELRHSDLRAGGSLRFVLGPQPGTWGNRDL